MVSSDSSATESSYDEYEIFFSNRAAASHKKRTVFPSSGSSGESSSDGTEETSTPSKPSSSVKCPRVVEENEPMKPSSKKANAIQMGEKENKSSREAERKKTAVTKVEKSAKKTGRIWNPKDEAAFLNELVARCEKGKGLPRNILPVYDQIRSKLDGDYTTNQLYDKQRGLRTKLGKFRGKVMDEGFSFKNDHEKTVYELSLQLWGKEEEDGSGDQKIGKKHVKECEWEDREEVKRNQVKESELKDREGVKRKLVKDSEVEQIAAAKRKHVKNGEGKAREGLKDVEGEERVEAKGQLVKNDEGKERQGVKRKLAKDVEGEGREEVKKKGGEPVEMSRKEQEEDGDTDEEDGEEDEVGGEANGNVNLTHGSPDQFKAMGWNQTALHVAESVPNRAGGREKGEEKDSSEADDLSEEDDLSDGRRKIATAGQYDNGRNLAVHDPNGSRKIANAYQHNIGGNLAVNDRSGSRSFARDDQRKLVDLLSKEGSRFIDAFRSEVHSKSRDMIRDMINDTKSEIMKMVDTALQVMSNTSMDANVEFQELSNAEVEMLERKWKTQQFVELEANSKHLTLLLEENQLRMAKFDRNLSS